MNMPINLEDAIQLIKSMQCCGICNEYKGTHLTEHYCQHKEDYVYRNNTCEYWKPIEV